MGQGLLRTVSTRAWACVAALAVLAGLVAAPAGAASRSGLPLALTVSTPQTTFGANALVSPMVFTVRAPVGGTDRVLMNIPTNQGWPAPFTSPSTARGYVTVQKGGCSYVAIQKLIKNLDGTWSVRVYTTCQAGKTFSITYRAGRAPTLAGASSFGFSRMSSGHQGLVPMTVTPGPVAKLAVSGPATATAGEDTAFSVTPQDQWGNTNPTYAGTVNLSGDDVATVLTGAGAWSGSGTYGANFQNPGARSVTATDAANSSITGTWNTTVSGIILPDYAIEVIPYQDGHNRVQFLKPLGGATFANLPVTITGISQIRIGTQQFGLMKVMPDGTTVAWDRNPPAGTLPTAPANGVISCTTSVCNFPEEGVSGTYTAVDDQGNTGVGHYTLYMALPSPIIIDPGSLPSNLIYPPGQGIVDNTNPADPVEFVSIGSTFTITIFTATLTGNVVDALIVAPGGAAMAAKVVVTPALAATILKAAQDGTSQIDVQGGLDDNPNGQIDFGEDPDAEVNAFPTATVDPQPSCGNFATCAFAAIVIASVQAIVGSG